MYQHKLTVRFKDCDMYGHVNHAVFLQYLESARVELLREAGLPLPIMMRNNAFLVIRRIDVTYHAPAFIDDELLVDTVILRLRRASGSFKQTIRLIQRDHETKASEAVLLVTALVDWAAVGKDGSPQALPEQLRSLETVD